MLNFSCDYLESAHDKIIKRIQDTNYDQVGAYGIDTYCDQAKEKIRELCGKPDADITFLVGGTQTNMITISALLRPFEGVIAANTGHIATHEAGAIEASGHKVLEVPHHDGKVSAEDVERVFVNYKTDGNKEHIVRPGLVYISQPTEYGTLYTLDELKVLSDTVHKHKGLLYLDGARLIYGLAAKGNDLTLKDIADLTDAFYIGGTKCGLLFGEALVFPNGCPFEGFFTYVKQKGALLAKGKLMGIQFLELFTDDLWKEIGNHADRLADQIREVIAQCGIPVLYPSTTNQILIKLNKVQSEKLLASALVGFWENCPDGDTVWRITTSWATTQEETDAFCEVLRNLGK